MYPVDVKFKEIMGFLWYLNTYKETEIAHIPNKIETIFQKLLYKLEKSRDNRLLSYYAEYLVANKLSKKHKVKLLKKRQGPDIELSDIDKKIEVKSSSIDMEHWLCGASFGNGSSIREKKFDYCVFVVFENFKPIEYLVFSHDELLEVIQKERGTFPGNPYVLYRFKNLEDYLKEIPEKNRLEIEIKLHKHPEEFQDRWDKIK